MARQKVIGLTGPTGAGKTTVSKVLAQNGYFIIDADQVARKVVLPGSECLLKIAEVFGGEVLNLDQSLNRQALGGIVFSNKDKLKQLEGIIFPYIIRDIQQMIKQSEEQGNHIVILDAPTLFESGCDKLCDKVIVVIAPLNARLMRIVSRDSITFEQAMQRISAQQNDAFYTQRADFVVDNAKPQADYSSLLSWLLSLQ